MKTQNKVLISISEDDLVKGVFRNNDVIEVADNCFNEMPSLKKIILLKVKKIGNDCFSSNQAMTEVSINKYKFNNIKCVDDSLFIIASKRTSQGIQIYSGYNFLSMEDKKIKKQNCFVAEKDKYFAHGESVKKAVGDLQFKIIAEKLKKEPIKKDTIMTMQHYRLITGACELGCRSWMKQNKITKERIKAEELLPILEKTNAWGLQQFKKLITF